jgi:hypothetical protein
MASMHCNMKYKWTYDVKLLHIDFMIAVQMQAKLDVCGDISYLFFTVESCNS